MIPFCAKFLCSVCLGHATVIRSQHDSFRVRLGAIQILCDTFGEGAGRGVATVSPNDTLRWEGVIQNVSCHFVSIFELFFNTKSH